MSILLASYLPFLAVLAAMFLGIRVLFLFMFSVCFLTSFLSAFLMWGNASYSFYEIFVQSAAPSFSAACTAIAVKYLQIKLTTKYETAKAKEETLEHYSKELEARYEQSLSLKENLEKRILKDDSFALKLQSAVSSLSSLKEKEIKSKLLEIAEEFLRAKSVVYYSYKGDRFYLSASLNTLKAPARIGKESPLYEAVITSSKTLSIKNELTQEGAPIMACKIMAADKQTIGFIAIYDMDFLDVNYASERLFAILCDWAGVSLGRAKVFEAKQKESRLFAKTGFFNFKYFVETLNKEILLARRYKIYFAVITVILKDKELMSADAFAQSVITLGYKIKHVFREVDSFFFNDIKNDRFHILLPMTYEDGANIALGKFLRDVELLGLKPYKDDTELLLDSSVFAVTPQTTTYESNIFVRNNS